MINHAIVARNSNFFEELLKQALAEPSIKNDSALAIDNILSGHTFYRKSFMPDPLSDLSFYLTILDNGAAGFSYYHGEPQTNNEALRFVNMNALDVIANDAIDFPLRVSILDSIYGVYNQIIGNTPDQIFSNAGGYKEKADFRSKLVTGQLKPGTSVLLVGLVTEFVRDMLEQNIDVSVSDLSPELSGIEVYGVPITNGGNAETLNKIAECDSAVVTGASITTNTIDSLFDTARKSSTDLHFYLETGNNFGPELIKRGAVSVVAEKFPFYDLPGETRFEIFRR